MEETEIVTREATTAEKVEEVEQHIVTLLWYKDQEYTVKLAATDWAGIGYNTGNSLYGPQSTPTGMKDNEGGLGGGMSIIYIGNRVFGICGGGGGGGKEGNGGDGGGCNVSASNGDGPSHGYGSNLSSVENIEMGQV